MAVTSNKASLDGVWDDGAWSVDRSAAHLDVCRAQIYKFMDRGLLVWQRLGARRVIAKKSVIDLLKNGTQASDVADVGTAG